MEINKLIQSKTFKVAIVMIFSLAILAGTFHLGVIVGYHKAHFSYQWGENYDRNFGGPRRAVFGVPFGSPRFMGAHGDFGSIVKIDNQAIVTRGDDNMERIVMVDSTTLIEKYRQTITIADLKPGDKIVVVGEPNDRGDTAAKLIRVLP